MANTDNLSPPAFELVLFDLDGVLADTSGCHRQAYADLWSRLEIPGPPYESIAGRRTDEVVVEVTADRAPSGSQVREWTAFKRRQALTYLARVEPLADVAPAVAAFQRAGLTMAVGTSASRSAATTTLARVLPGQVFDAVVTGEDVERGKPAPDVFEEAIRRCGACAERTLIVEDTAVGVDAALAAGAWAVVVRGTLGGDHPRRLGCYPDLLAVTAALGFEDLPGR